MKCSFYTLGCKVNQYETELMAKSFKANGYKICDFGMKADVIVINSCTVTATSDQKVRQVLHKARRNFPSSVIVLCGCMPQAFPGKKDEWQDADIIMGNSNRKNVVACVEEFLKNHNKSVNIEEHAKDYLQEHISEFGDKTRAFLKIEDGCDCFCSYCVIPYARGRVRSKPLEDIENEVKALSKSGYKEVVLVGINLCAYGSDIEKNLTQAIKAAADVDGIERVRLGSLEPDLITPEIIEQWASIKKLCPQFHLSLQSGCDKTLLRMNRHYTAEGYKKIVRLLRENFENCAITTDIMVGFPGEDKTEFEQSLKTVEDIAFSQAHIFAYSMREGTRAYDMENQVTSIEKSERSNKMQELTNKSQKEFLRSQIGKQCEVLFETKIGEHYMGYTKNYCLVKIHSDTDIQGQVRNVLINSEDGEFLFGRGVYNQST